MRFVEVMTVGMPHVALATGQNLTRTGDRETYSVALRPSTTSVGCTIAEV